MSISALQANRGLEVESLTVKYGRVIALSSATLAVAPGQIVAVVGPNGAGKSSLLRCASGLVRATAGQCRLDGHDLG